MEYNMGCFNGVCAVSHIPIQDNDPVVKLYIASVYDFDYHVVQWRAISLPIWGKYNDVGDIKDFKEDNVGWKFIQHIVSKHFKDVTLPTGRREKPLDVFIDNLGTGQLLPDAWTFGGKSEFKKEERQEWDNRDFDEYRQVKGNGSSVQQILIHQKVFVHLVAEFYNTAVNPFSDKPKVVTHLDDVPEFLEEARKKVEFDTKCTELLPDMDALKKYLADNNLSNIGMFRGVVPTYLDGIANKFGERSQHLLFLIFDRGWFDHRPMNLHAGMALSEMFADLIKENDISTATKLLMQLCDLQAFVGGLALHNMEVTPFTGHASEIQGHDVDEANKMIRFNRMCISIEKDKIKEEKRREEE